MTAALQPKWTNMPAGALRIDSSCAEAVIELGVMYTNEGKGDDAIALYAPPHTMERLALLRDAASAGTVSSCAATRTLASCARSAALSWRARTVWGRWGCTCWHLAWIRPMRA